MKRKFLSLILVSALFSCTSEIDEVSPSSKENQPVVESAKMDVSEAQKDFAKLLSKAVYNDINIRRFLKDEGVRQFDRDYDVFYPLVKDKIVSNDKTFREVLLSYCEDETELSKIENTLPLLNILIPDLTFVSDFNADTWDISDNEVPVSYTLKGTGNVLYANGDSVVTLKSGEIPGFPVLVVKNNERMKVAGQKSRSGEVNYEFVDDVFKAESLQSRGNHYDQNVEPDETENYLKPSELDPKLIQAWNEKVPNACQRDYIYYNMNKANASRGVLDIYIREKLLKFKIEPSYLDRLSTDGEPKFNTDFTKKKASMSVQEIYDNLWTDGSFEFYFDIYIGTPSGTKTQRLICPVKARDVFALKKIHVNYIHSTGFRHSKYIYSASKNDLMAKWIYPENAKIKSELFTAPWDLSSQSITITIFAYEYDPATTVEKTIQIGEEFAGSANFSVDSIGKFPIKLGFNVSNKTSHSYTLKVTTTETSDDLGTLNLNYVDPIIKNDQLKNSKGYEVYTVSSGVLTAMFIPESLLKK